MKPEKLLDDDGRTGGWFVPPWSAVRRYDDPREVYLQPDEVELAHYRAEFGIKNPLPDR